MCVHLFNQKNQGVYEKKLLFFNCFNKKSLVSTISSFVSVGNQKIV
ncbi:hypothetical protein HOB94_00615 [bacterium]|nr:hypothetical protein [bacterium]